jgi:hypothetical protein
MNLRKLSLITAMAGMSTIGLIGCSSNIDDFTTVSGTAIDDTLHNAVVCVDTNNNGDCSDENNTKSNSDGTFSVVVLKSKSTQPMVAQITSDTTQTDASGNVSTPPKTTLKAPAGSTVVTPLTTLVQVAVEQGIYKDLATAKAAVATALGLTGTDVTTLDYISSGSSNSSGTKVSAIAKAVASAMQTLTTAVQGAGVTDSNVAVNTAVTLLLSSSSTGTTLSNLVSNPSATVTAPPAAEITKVADTVSTNISNIQKDANTGSTTPPVAPVTGLTSATGSSS